MPADRALLTPFCPAPCLSRSGFTGSSCAPSTSFHTGAPSGTSPTKRDDESSTDAFTWRRSQYHWRHKAEIGCATAVAVARRAHSRTPLPFTLDLASGMTTLPSTLPTSFSLLSAHRHLPYPICLVYIWLDKLPFVDGASDTQIHSFYFGRAVTEYCPADTPGLKLCPNMASIKRRTSHSQNRRPGTEHRNTDTQRQKRTDRDAQRKGQRRTETDTQTQRQGQGERQTQRQGQGQGQRQRQRQGQRQTETETVAVSDKLVS